ncbi:MAG: HIT family protein [Planctomycetota bacterium]|jgi:histidine triad (HIT) family protein
MSSIFTKIVNGEIPCHKVYEDEDHLAFLDIRPIVPGHTLVIPKREEDYIFDLSDEEHAALWDTARKVASRLKQVLGCKRVCVGLWGYEVAHAHVHLFPTNSLGDFPMPPQTKAGAASDPAELAGRLSF